MSNRRTPHLAALLAALLCFGVVAVTPVLGATRNGFSAVISCGGFTPSGGGFTADRDNTGRGLESIAINAIDGNGDILFQLVDAVPVGWGVTPGAVTYNWTTAPAANPISMSVVSLAGNELDQQVVYTTSGTCAGLPTGTVTDATNLTGNIIDTGGSGLTTVSPSIFPGNPLPTPTSNAAVIEQLPFYAIVNTPRLNLRSGDGPQYLPVGVVPGGTRARLIGRNRGTSWWLLEIGNVRGWASAEFLAVRGNARSVPFIDDSAGDLTPVTLVTSLPKRVYSAPNDFDTSYVCDVNPGEYAVVGKDRFDVFYQIFTLCTDGQLVTAWIRAENGVFRNPAALQLPVTD